MSDIVKVNSLSSWVLASDISATVVIPSKIASLTEGDNTYYIMVTDKDGNIAVYELQINRKLPLYTVTFVSNGVVVETQTVEKGGFATSPEVERTGYEFIGWDYYLSLPITSNITVEAVWKIKHYTITYNLFGGQNNAQNKVNFTVEDLPLTLSGASKQGYKFDGWFNSDYSQQITEIDDCDNIDLYASFIMQGMTYVPSQDNEYYLISEYNGYASQITTDSVYRNKPIKAIADGAFSNCLNVTKIVLSENIASIGAKAFEYCEKLTTISLGDSLTTLGDRAFYGCVGLQNIVIPASVLSIGEEVFEYCDNLNTIYYKGSQNDWKNISINQSNAILANANIYFYSEDKPSESNRFWHYVNGVPTVWTIEENYTYNTYTAVSPSDWNELTYKDGNDDQIIDYINSPFFEFDYKFDNDGNIIAGDYEVKYSAATALTDVTARYADKFGYAQGAKGYAWQITLRNDLKWDDGTPITAEDFVYSMKEQLNPLFRNYRADAFFEGALVVSNARSYAMQGLSIDERVINLFAGISEAKIAGYTNIYLDYNAINEAFEQWFGGTYEQVQGVGYFDQYFTIYQNGEKTDLNFFEKYNVLNSPNKQIIVTDAMISDYENCLDWYADTNIELAMMSVISGYVYPEFSWNDVGFFVGDTQYDIVICLEKALPLLKEDGSLSYQAVYNIESLPLVKKDLYETCKIQPATDSLLWTTNYNTSVATTASWGPYKLTSFQAGKKYVLERNENWYGYTANLYEGQYQTDKIVCETVADWENAWLQFQKGEIDSISIDISIASDYKGSEQAYFTPTDFVSSIQLQSSEEGLKNRERAGINKTILTYTEFRQALSLAIDRTALASACTTSSLAGFGLFNSMHYYDVENGKVYRESDEAKRVLCEVYGINIEDYESLDDAVNAITGYNLAYARSLVNIAYNKALADGKIKATDKVQLVWGTAMDNESSRRTYEFVKNAWYELIRGTQLAGRFELLFDASFGTNWANDFRAGAYDVCAGGWTGAAWDPGYFLLAYLSPDYMYSVAWDTSAQMMTFTMPVDGVPTELTMSLMDWYDCLNGNAGAAYDWSANAVDQEIRLPLIAALEKEILNVYYTLPIYNDYTASLMSYKTDYITYEYNTFMEYGGIRYMTYNYTDAEWEDYVASQNGMLNYK